MMMSCLCGVQTTQTQMMSCHVSCTQHEWNANPNDVYTLLNPNDVTLGICVTCMHAWW